MKYSINKIFQRRIHNILKDNSAFNTEFSFFICEDLPEEGFQQTKMPLISVNFAEIENIGFSEYERKRYLMSCELVFGVNEGKTNERKKEARDFLNRFVDEAKNLLSEKINEYFCDFESFAHFANYQESEIGNMGNNILYKGIKIELPLFPEVSRKYLNKDLIFPEVVVPPPEEEE
jgi:hypothetical protein